MIPNPWPGSHFVFEGIDGCGKSTQVQLAFEFFRKRFGDREAYDRVILTKEPSNKRFWGKKIYADLNTTTGINTTNPVGFQSWFSLDSKENYKTVIIPHLQQLGHVVLSDRSRPSMVFGAQNANQIRELMHLNMSILGDSFIWPDAIFIFDVNAETALKRAQQKGRKLDGHENIPVMNRVRKNYLAFAKKYPNCYVISAEAQAQEVFKSVEKIISERF